MPASFILLSLLLEAKQNSEFLRDSGQTLSVDSPWTAVWQCERVVCTCCTARVWAVLMDKTVTWMQRLTMRMLWMLVMVPTGGCQVLMTTYPLSLRSQALLTLFKITNAIGLWNMLFVLSWTIAQGLTCHIYVTLVACQCTAELPGTQPNNWWLKQNTHTHV